MQKIEAPESLPGSISLRWIWRFIINTAKCFEKSADKFSKNRLQKPKSKQISFDQNNSELDEND